MKVLFVNTSADTGGAAIAASRIMSALEKQGVATRMVTRSGKGLPFYLERLGIWLSNGLRRKNLFAVDTASSGEDITRSREFREADIIHLHWINQGFLSLRGIRRILDSGKPVVWTMHDMWPLAGICHYSNECNGYSASCGNCPCLKKASGNDLSAAVFEKKRSIYRNGNLTFVCCSRWLEDRVSSSSLLGRHRLLSIPNPIDADFFSPSDKTEARRRLGLPSDVPIVLFGAARVSDPRKGIDYFTGACKCLAAQGRKVEVLVYGRDSDCLEGRLPFKLHPMGYVSDRETLCSIYRAADLFAIPSLDDNLPNSIMEAMACGTPCVGFNVGGIPEMIDHRVNGYVAEYKSASDFADGISWVLSQKDLLLECRRKVLESYSETVVARRYLELYGSLLSAD